MTFKIEKGVPVPPTRGFEPRPIPYPFADMAMGDSFAVPVPRGETAEHLRQAVGKVAQRYRDRVQADFAVLARVRVEKGETVVRVWRVKFTPRPTRKVRIDSYMHTIDGGKHPAKKNGRAACN